MIWHYPNVGLKSDAEETEDEKKSLSTLEYDKEFSWRTKYYSYLSPNIFVIDFDHTLAVYDGNQEVTAESTRDDQLPSVYARPFMFEFLQFLKRVNRNNILILWTRAKKLYISKIVLLLGIGNYFDHILSRSDCKNSYKTYGCHKSFHYILDKYPNYTNMRSFLIDNLAYKNGTKEDDSSTGYFRLLSVKPFVLPDAENGSDSTLLNLMLYLDRNFFEGGIKKSILYTVIAAKPTGNLSIETRFAVSKCDLLIHGWYPKM